MTAVLAFENNKTAAMLVFLTIILFLLFQLICIAADHVSENPLYMYPP